MDNYTIIMIATLLSAYAIFHGAVYGRLDGGGITKSPEWVERSLIMFFFVLATAPFAGMYSLLAYVGVLGIATGHGQYFLHRSAKYMTKTKERVDPVVKLFFGQDPRDDEHFKDLPQNHEEIVQAMDDYGMGRLYARCVFGMFVTGSLVGLPAFILCAVFGHAVIGSIFLLTGVCKAVAYVTSYELWKNTEGAEFINGGLRTTLCVIALLLNFFVVGSILT